MQEYESVLLSKAVIAKLVRLKNVAQHTDNPTLNEIIQSMASEFNILAESSVALIWNGFEYEMVNRKEVEEP
jgi:ABC-type methionine transport system ATPase subunit